MSGGRGYEGGRTRMVSFCHGNYCYQLLRRLIHLHLVEHCLGDEGMYLCFMNCFHNIVSDWLSF